MPSFKISSSVLQFIIEKLWFSHVPGKLLAKYIKVFGKSRLQIPMCV